VAVVSGLLGLFAVIPLQFTLAAQTADPPSTPFLRIETGMHAAMIWRIDTDAAGRFLVTASDDKTARVWNLENGNLLKVLRPPQGYGNDGKLNAVAISPDGATLAAGGWTGATGSNNAIYLFDRASGTLRRRLDGLPGVVNHLSYSPDGRYLVAALSTNGIRVYSTSAYQEVARDAEYGDRSLWAEFDRASRLVTASFDGSVRLYGTDFRPVAKRPARGGKQPFSVRFSPDGTKVALGFNDSAAVNVLSGQDLSFLYAPDTSQVSRGNVCSVAWSRDGRILYASGKYFDGSGFPVLSWTDGGRGRVRRWPAAHNTGMDLRALPGGRLAFGAATPPFGVLNADGGVLWQRAPEILSHRENTNKLRLSRDGSVVEFGFDTVTPQGNWSRRLARFTLTERRLSLDPGQVGSLNAPRTTGLDVANWENSEKPSLNGRGLPLQQYETSESLAISAQADSFLLGTAWYLRLFDRQGREQWKTPAPDIAWGVNLTADSRYAVAALGDGTLRWYTTNNGEEVLALFVHPDGRRWVFWTPEGFFDASAGGDALIGYHLNQGGNREGEFIKVEQVFNVFYRPDLIVQRLQPGGAAAVRAAREGIGDIAAVLAGGLPPEIELLSPPVSESQGEFVLQARVENRGGGVGRVVYRIDGVEIQGRPIDIPSPVAGSLNRRFDLGPGKRVVSMTVYNGRNQLESRSVSAIVNVKQSEQRPALFVVAAGVSEYRDHALNQGVKFAAADAETMAARLKEQGEGLFREVATYPLTNGNATRDNIGKTIAAVAARMQPSDVFVLYLAGHGTALDGEYYFIPWEVRYTNEKALREQSLNQEALRLLLKQIPASKTLLLLDTCGSGAFTAGRALPISEKAAIEKLAKLTGRAVLAASASDQMALEGHQGHGVFTFAVLEGLSKAANDAGLVEVSRLADFVEDQVPKITKERWGYEQFPMRSIEGQTFPIARTRRP